MSRKANDLSIGGLVKSKAGHDKDQMYVIVGRDETCIYVVNGESRCLQKPKRKNPKHVQMVHHYFELEGMDDVQIKRGIKLFAKTIKEEKI